MRNDEVFLSTNRWGKILSCMVSLQLIATGCALASTVESDKSEILLVSGEAMAAGGMGAITPLDVCDPSRLNQKNIGQLLGSALTDINLSLEPTPDDGYKAVGVGKSWRTAAAALGSSQIADYNKDAAEKLPVNTKLYFHFLDGLITISDDLVTLSTRTMLERGTSYQWREPFTGFYSSRYFHNQLRSALERELTKNGCQK